MALIKIKESRGTSDFLVCEVSSRSVARGNDHLWCFIESSTSADSKVCFVNSRTTADLLICYVSSRIVAGWRKEHPLKNKIG